MYYVFAYHVIPTSEPRLQGSHSVLNGTPGLVVMPVDTDGLIYYKVKDMHNAAPYISMIDRELKEKHGIECHDDGTCNILADKADYVKHLKRSALFPNNSLCNKKTNFGFSIGKPCFIVRVNKVYNWKPEPYTSLSDIPSEFPKYRYHKNFIGIYCYGLDSPDKDNLGRIVYMPISGIPFEFFPYLNQKHYVSAFTWIQLIVWHD
ncbi:potassium-transporting ATPase subunit beta-like [Octopus vulgaris]|uniref:Potassium-transporting ATPase subunit beta-like n=1 Tax=Octopus vulgaris TaxID=6645 RepID=A0AA36AP32_OCTVU|nr:potassium-transporting ATPase subunit beta-like [Octopus vulgaris]